MDIRFHIDPETGQPHIFEHGVTEDEAREVLRRPREDRAGDEDSRVAIGQTIAGRYLKVIYARDPVGDSVFVITAFDLTGKPLKAYRRRQRRKRR
ncbi:MAG TPA: hypothetical protein VG013_14100 [Gemmataceae bacterium]|jgi:hypothetical protein|nr:hypothetical protein [Gemmataceae bacterium]